MNTSGKSKAGLFTFSILFFIFFNAIMSYALSYTPESPLTLNFSSNGSYAFKQNITYYNESGGAKSYSIGFIKIPTVFNPIINFFVFIGKALTFHALSTNQAIANAVIGYLEIFIIAIMIYSVIPFI